MIHTIEPFLISSGSNSLSRQIPQHSFDNRLKSLKDSISAQNILSSIPVAVLSSQPNNRSGGKCNEVQFKLSYLSAMLSRVAPEHMCNS